MARIKRSFWKVLLTSLFIFCFVCFLLNLKNLFFPQKFSAEKPDTPKLKYDEFDPSLMRLNTMVKLEDYCDSLYMANSPIRTFPGIVQEVVRKKFYHGYSYYNAYSNPMAKFLSLGIGEGANAIVLANDIVKFPYAACSQQSIVCMELFKRKGYKVRKVTMYDAVTKQGHFTFEALYDNKWHFFDTNMEPDMEVLRKYNKPSVAFLNAHPDIIALAYRDKGPELFQRLLKDGKIGPVNKNPAPFASLLQYVTKYLNYFGWLLIGLVLLVRNAIPARSFAWVKRKQNQFQPINTQLQGREARA
jgi:hypothetical protein